MAFRYFAILADMRTGSNHLEDELGRFSGVSSYGELFNPLFVGRPSAEYVLGFDVRARNADPLALLDAMIQTDDPLPGFRLFRDHDPRALAYCLNDTSCAKIVLTRRPIESFVSLEIARETNLWWMGNDRNPRSPKVKFDTDAYREYLASLSRYRSDIRRQLQISGQTAFFVDYDEINDPKTVIGLAKFLGLDPDSRSARGRKSRPQNPEALADKLTNPVTAQRAAKSLHDHDFETPPEFEPLAPPPVNGFVGCSQVPLLHLALVSKTADAVNTWLMETDRSAGGEPHFGMDQKDLRRWLRKNTGHTSFSVVEHPLLRAYHAFLEAVAAPETRNHDLCAVLENDFGYSGEDEREDFRAFLMFLEPNLKTQTAVVVDKRWSSQTAQLQAMSSVVIPQRILTRDQLGEVTYASLPDPLASEEALAELADDDLNALARRAYRRDYLMFGFGSF